ncbi:MAG: hypothetical protein ACI9TY_000986 [Alphaproteobacteria bacterium]|jgi:hypothetical protein
MSFMDKYRNKIAGAMMAYGGLVGVAGNAMAQEAREIGGDSPTVATAQVDQKMSVFDQYKLEQQQQMDNFQQSQQDASENAMNAEPQNEHDARFAELQNGVQQVDELGASSMNIRTVTKDGLTESTVTHNGTGEVSIDENGEIKVEMSAEEIAAEAERHEKREQWLDMNEKISENGVTAHSINKDIREVLTANECGAEISDSNLIHNLSNEEISNLHNHMKNLDPAHTLNADVLYKLAQAECSNDKVTGEIADNIQINLEVGQGKDFAQQYGLDEAEVNASYDIER